MNVNSTSGMTCASSWESIESEIQELDQKQRSLLSLANLIKLKSSSIAEDLRAHVGSGACSYEQHEEVESQLQKKLDQLNSSLDYAIKEISKCNIGVDNVESTISSAQDEAGIASAPLPIIEIFEQLGEEGDILHAKLNDEPFLGREWSSDPEKDETLPNSASNCQVTNDGSQNQLSRKEAGSFEAEEKMGDKQLGELFRDMEVTDSFDDMAENPTESKSSNYQSDMSPRADMQDIYELETLVGQIQSTEVESETDSDAFDYDFEEIGSEGSEDVSIDFEDGMDLSILPGNSEVSLRLRDEIVALRMKKTQTSFPVNHESQKQVRFDDTLQIKEIENISAELKEVEPRKRRVSKFKSLVSPQEKATKTQVIKDSGPKMHTIYSNHTQSDDEEVMFNVFERNGTSDEEAQSHPLRDVSDSEDSERGTRFSREIQGTVEHFTPYDSQTMALNELDDSQNETDELARAYNQGTFDNETEVTGPLIEKLDDFAVLNKILESMPAKSETFGKDLRGSVVNSEWSTSTETELDDVPASSDEDVLADEITEREDISWDSPDDTPDNIHSADDVEQFLMDKNISEQYNRLKKKLFSQASI